MRTPLLLAALVMSSCGPEETPGIASTPLAGTVSGAPWKALSATASARKAFSDDLSERWIDVGAGTFDCDTFGIEPELIGTIPWSGTGYGFSLQQNLTIVTREDGETINRVALRGRVELVTLTEPGGEPSVLRIRAEANDDNVVEGEIQVTVCD